MANDRLPDRYRPDRQPSRRSPRTPQRRSGELAGSDAIPVYGPAALEFVDGADRNACWQMFGPQLRTRLNARAGKILDWWANQTAEGRPRAVVLGDRALVKAEPTRNDRGAPATLVVTTQLHTASFRFIEVAERADAGSSHGHGGMRPGRREMVVPGPRLDEQMTAFLGNLPAKAQVFLQAPFLNDFAGLDYERYYFRTNDAAGEELFVGCYLANGHQLTFASGIRRIWTGIPTAAWQLICRQATIIDPSHQRS